jgi:hypothetical protein
MAGAFGGGWALGVAAEGLAKTATSGQYRAGLVSDHLTLVPPFDPDVRWVCVQCQHLERDNHKFEAFVLGSIGEMQQVRDRDDSQQ